MTCFLKVNPPKEGTPKLQSKPRGSDSSHVEEPRLSLHRFHGFFQHRSPPEPHRQGSPGLKWRWYQETSTGKNPPSERVSKFQVCQVFLGGTCKFLQYIPVWSWSYHEQWSIWFEFGWRGTPTLCDFRLSDWELPQCRDKLMATHCKMSPILYVYNL